MKLSRRMMLGLAAAAPLSSKLASRRIAAPLPPHGAGLYRLAAA